MGVEAVSQVRIAWLRVLGQREFGAPSDPPDSHRCAQGSQVAACKETLSPV